MVHEDFAKALACLVSWREERANKLNGMMGVLFLLRNRVKAGWFHGDWVLNITAKNQFSSMSRIGDSQTVEYPDPRDPEWQALLQNVEPIFSGEAVDNLTAGALYYCDPGPGITPGGWFAREIIGKPDEHPQVAKIGTTLYFK